jgi:hypothetical protein
MNLPINISLESALLVESGAEQAARKERVLILGFLYLQVGLTPEAAYRSALADYQCGLTN